ncbi:hypothetical protein CKM354_000694600 [Cercospora kikuchii]|uniref:Uncharacterized protein n=1 Tax=Cercospora kikuchii TaxID=84275 RepID=A0A9P3CJ12_9PEZI|nr:uncharacterized protein CKM354_000694600 [Cercospora kikuchii]GIZ43729.1 hypothetical protein CKM354_000694600 [Cercospora kikuchii]
MESKKRIKICWGTSVQSASFRQTIVNHKTGTARTWEKQEPSHWKQKGTVLGNPEDPENYHSERKSVGVPRRQDYKLQYSSSSSSSSSQEDKDKSKPADKIADYDTSQL